MIAVHSVGDSGDALRSDNCWPSSSASAAPISSICCLASTPISRARLIAESIADWLCASNRRCWRISGASTTPGVAAPSSVTRAWTSAISGVSTRTASAAVACTASARVRNACRAASSRASTAASSTACNSADARVSPAATEATFASSCARAGTADTSSSNAAK